MQQGDFHVVKPTRAIIVAAGLGKRLRPYTDSMPKSLVPIAGKPMLVRTLECFRNIGVKEFIIVKGYKGEVFEERISELGDGITFVENKEFETNNILVSLFKAEQFIAQQEPFYFSYSDIIFAQNVADQLRDASGDICLIVDKEFSKIYEGRTDHPLEQAELCTLDNKGNVDKVGKCCCPYNEGVGEFIGLAKFSSAGASQLHAAYKDLEDVHQSTNSSPFPRAATWLQSYVCDLLEHMTQHNKIKMDPVFIEGRWREIDTVQDKHKADEQVDW